FREPIAHGLLVLSVSSGLGLFAPPVRTIAFIQFKEWFFREPVKIGDTIKVRCKILDIESNSRGRRGTVTWHRQVINQHGKIVQEGVTVTLVEGRGEKNNSKSIN
ncbi:MAG: dehydratase, partial [Planctomycetes bacterium]|nr:dehydratase [Planctomycetota bacterium]